MEAARFAARHKVVMTAQATHTDRQSRLGQWGIIDIAVVVGI